MLGRRARKERQARQAYGVCGRGVASVSDRLGPQAGQAH